MTFQSSELENLWRNQSMDRWVWRNIWINIMQISQRRFFVSLFALLCKCSSFMASSVFVWLKTTMILTQYERHGEKKSANNKQWINLCKVWFFSRGDKLETTPMSMSWKAHWPQQNDLNDTWSTKLSHSDAFVVQSLTSPVSDLRITSQMEGQHASKRTSEHQQHFFQKRLV